MIHLKETNMKITNSELIVKEEASSLEKTKADLKKYEDKDMKEVLASEHTRKHDRKRRTGHDRQGS